MARVADHAPEGAVYWYSVESVFRRAALWRVPAPGKTVEAAVRVAANEAWPAVEEKRRGSSVLELSFEAGGLRSLIKVTAQPEVGSVVSVGQKILALRFDEAEQALQRPEI